MIVKQSSNSRRNVNIEIENEKLNSNEKEYSDPPSNQNDRIINSKEKRGYQQYDGMEQNINSRQMSSNSKEINKLSKDEYQNIQGDSQLEEIPVYENLITENQKRQLSKDQEKLISVEKSPNTMENENPVRNETQETREKKLAIKDSLAASYNFQIIDNKKKQNLLKQNDLELERRKLDQIRQTLEKEKEEKLKAKEKVKQESLKYMQMKLKEKEDQKNKTLNEQKAQQVINEEKLRVDIEKEIQKKVNLAKNVIERNNIKENMHIHMVENPRRRKENEIEQWINKNQQDYHDIQNQNQQNYELVRKQNLINARKVNEEMINQKKQEKEDYKKNYYNRAQEGIEMSLQNDTYSMLLKEDRLNEQKKYNEFLKDQISLKNNLGKISTLRNEEVMEKQNKRINLEDSTKVMQQRTVQEMMIPGIFNLSSIGSKPTCRGGRMIMNSLDMYKAKINDNLGQLKRQFK